MPDIERRFTEITRRIEEACQRSGRHPQDVVLVGASKTQPAAVLAEAGTRVAAALVTANLVTAEGDERESAAASCARSAAMVRERMGE